MKQYFAKYLPIDGEIKECDRAFMRPNGLVEEFSGNQSLIHNIEAMNNSGCKKVELFLCSRDVNAIDYGEKVFFESSNKWGVISSINFDETDVIKVIGKISPSAIWVKEGDEFKLTDFNPLSAAAIEHNEPLTSPIRIKGPCGHFH